MGPELSDRVTGAVVDLVQQDGRALVKEVGAQGRDGGGGSADVEPEEGRGADQGLGSRMALGVLWGPEP